MNVTIIGAGNMGRGIAHRLVSGGHDVTVVDRDPEEAEQLVEQLRGAAEGSATVKAAGPGPLERARQLEGLGFLGITLQQPLGLNFQSACKLIS